MACLVLKGAPLLSEISEAVVVYLVDQLKVDIFNCEDDIILKISCLDFIYRVFLAHQGCHIKLMFHRHGILLKLESLLAKLEQCSGHLYLILKIACLGVLYQLSTVAGICSRISANQKMVYHIISALHKNQSDWTIKFAVGCLSNFQWFHQDLVFLFEDLSGHKMLLKTASISSQVVKIDIMKIFNNFNVESSVSKKPNKASAVDENILKFIFDIFHDYVESKLQFGNKGNLLLQQCLMYLSCSIVNKGYVPGHFYTLGGLQLICRLLHICPPSMPCRQYILQVVKCMVYGKLTEQSHRYIPRQRYLGLKSYLPALKTVEDHLTSFRLNDKCNEDAYSLVRRPVQQQDGYYQYGSKVSFVRDSTHEILPFVRQNRSNNIGETVCGMLNSRKDCTLYFGISDDSRVVGVALSRYDRDRFRQFCDQIFTTLMVPSVLSNLTVQFKPVVGVGKRNSSNFFIIEIHTSANETFYSFKGKIYSRQNCETHRVEAEMLRLMVIGSELKKWKLEEKLWKNQLGRVTAVRQSQERQGK
ncbi:hypothetical protein Ahia01_000219700 [Argonauta hians]